MQISSNEISPGIAIQFKNAVWEVLSTTRVSLGPGAELVQLSLKNLLTNDVITMKFRAGEKLEKADVQKRRLTYIQRDGARHVLMDSSSCEMIAVDESAFGGSADLLREGLEGLSGLIYKGRIVRVELPNTVELKVAQIIRSDIISGGGKQVRLESGAIVAAPFHVEVGDWVCINVRTREYTV